MSDGGWLIEVRMWKVPSCLWSDLS